MAAQDPWNYPRPELAQRYLHFEDDAFAEWVRQRGDE
jgi:hypothetical protein